MTEVMRPEPRAMGNLFGREDAIREGRCLSCSATFTAEQIAAWNEMAQKEYTTCGLCRSCQALVFGCTCDNPCCEADIGVGVINCGSQHCTIHGIEPEAAS